MTRPQWFYLFCMTLFNLAWIGSYFYFLFCGEFHKVIFSCALFLAACLFLGFLLWIVYWGLVNDQAQELRGWETTSQHLQRANQKLTDANAALVSVCEAKEKE